MTLVQKLSGGFLTILLCTAAYFHITKPGASDGLIPNFMPKYTVHVITAIVEATLGIGIFIPKYSELACKGVFWLMVAFLPLHIYDLFSAAPVIRPKVLAIARVPLQFVLMYLAWIAGNKFQIF